MADTSLVYPGIGHIIFCGNTHGMCGSTSMVADLTKHKNARIAFEKLPHHLGIKDGSRAGEWPAAAGQNIYSPVGVIRTIATSKAG